jgi:hypothetical protein
MLLVLDAGRQRCPMCRTPVGGDDAIVSPLLGIPEPAATFEEAVQPARRGWRPRRYRRSTTTPFGDWVFEDERGVDLPRVARNVGVRTAEPRVPVRVAPRWGWQLWRPRRHAVVIDYAEPAIVETAAAEDRAPEPALHAVEAPPTVHTAPVPEAVAPAASLHPREPNPMWRDRVFRGAPDEVQHEPVLWPRRTHS